MSKNLGRNAELCQAGRHIVTTLLRVFFQRGERNGNRVEDIAGENTARTAAFFGKSQGLTDDGMTVPPQHDTLPRDKHG